METTTPPALAVTLLGTGCPRPDPRRAGPAQVVWLGDRPVLVDAGEGVTRQALAAGIDPARVEHLLLTHLHADHIFGYGHFVYGGWLLGRQRLTVFGPPGTARLTDLLFHAVYAETLPYFLTLGRPPEGLTDLRVEEVDDGATFTLLDATVRVRRVTHVAHTLALRFDRAGRSLVISGDTTYTASLIELASGADLLVCDACTMPSRRGTRIALEHATPAEAGRMARQAGVGTLVLPHLLPAADEAETLAECRAEFAGEIVVGRDLLTLACPDPAGVPAGAAASPEPPV